MLCLALFLSLVLVTTCQTKEEEHMFMRILQNCCQPELPKERALRVATCEKNVDPIVRALFARCVSETLLMPEVTLPLICYRAFPGREVLNTCVDREMSAQQQKQMRTEYLGCLLAAI